VITQEHRDQATLERWGKFPHVIGLSPRSVINEASEAEAWRGAILAAAGRVQPSYVVHGGRVIGATIGRSHLVPDVAYVRFRHGEKPSMKARMRDDLLDLTIQPKLWAGWGDYNALINDITTNGKFGRTYFAKPHTSAGVANNWYDLWPVGGNPASGSIANTAFTATNVTDATTGTINKRGNVSTDVMRLLSFQAVAHANTQIITLYDRVLIYDLNTFNAASNKVLTNTNTAARYNTGAPGLLCFICVCATTGATAANLTQFRYTDQAGNTLHSMPTSPTVTFVPSATTSSATLGARIIIPIVSGQTVTWGPYVPLANGDSGMRLVNDFTTSAANTGSFCIILMKPLADIVLPNAGIASQVDRVFQISELERIFDGAGLALMSFIPATTAYTLMGGITFGWGA
jgi:hypothetical protein